MPKLRETDQQKRERFFLAAVERGKTQQGFRYDKDVAEALGMNKDSYSLYKRKAFQNLNFSLFCKMARLLKLTGREVCTIIGVPYE